MVTDVSASATVSALGPRYRAPMEFRILGPISAVDATGPRPLGGSQQRRLLAVMLSEPTRVLSIEQILDVLWPDGTPPSNAHRTAISYVSRLRASLGDGWITSAGSGYTLDLSGATVDAQRFEDLTVAARLLDGRRAAEVWDEALALWRGAVFGELAGEWWALPTVRRLEELRLDALAARLDASVADGWEARGVADAQALVSAHPLPRRVRRAVDPRPRRLRAHRRGTARLRGSPRRPRGPDRARSFAGAGGAGADAARVRPPRVRRATGLIASPRLPASRGDRARLVRHGPPRRATDGRP